MSDEDPDVFSVGEESSNDEMEGDQGKKKEARSVYLPGGQMAEDEELVCDESAYVVYHQAETGAPCLSFDILHDESLSSGSPSFPASCRLVAGTQAARAHVNNVIVMEMSNIHRSKVDRTSDSEDEDEELDNLPVISAAMIKHQGCINRIRTTVFGATTLAASWSELGKVHIFDLSRPLEALDDPNVMSVYTRNEESPDPIFTFEGHQAEGFGMDWSPIDKGTLATGDCTKNIYLWHPSEGAGWEVSGEPYIGHTSSVEDIQWSRNEANVFASCSVDKCICIWDARATPSKACMIKVKETHERDVNVISWNCTEPFILSGGDDGVLKVWDLRQFKKGSAVAEFKHHTQPITTVEWHPTDSSVFASGGSDDQITLWDLAVERDKEVEGEDVKNLPPQLLFIHQGQQDIKELHWHPQIPGLILSTALSGFNVFKTISV